MAYKLTHSIKGYWCFYDEEHPAILHVVKSATHAGIPDRYHVIYEDPYIPEEGTRSYLTRYEILQKYGEDVFNEIDSTTSTKK